MAGNSGTVWNNLNTLEQLYVSSYPNIENLFKNAPYPGKDDPAGAKLTAALQSNQNGFCARLNQALADPEIRARVAALPPDVMAKHVDKLIAQPENLPAILNEAAPKADARSSVQKPFAAAAEGQTDAQPIAAMTLGKPSLSAQFTMQAAQPLLPLTPDGIMPVVQAMTPNTPQAAATLAREASQNSGPLSAQGQGMQDMMQKFQTMFNGPGFDGLKNMFGDVTNHLSGILGALGNVLKSILGQITEKMQGFSAGPRMIVSNQPGGKTPMADALDELNGQKPQTVAFTQDGQKAPAPAAQTPPPPEQEKRLASTGMTAPGMT